jgi:hypothetical protein
MRTGAGCRAESFKNRPNVGLVKPKGYPLEGRVAMP